MSDTPSESIKILDTVKNVHMSHNEVARFALLYSQAKDKNWIDETDDSLISVAVNYFEHSRLFNYSGWTNNEVLSIPRRVVELAIYCK